MIFAVPLSPASRVTVPADTLMRVVDGQSVLLSLKSERYYGLDEIGTRAWTLLAAGKSVRETAEELGGEFAAPVDRIAADVEALVGELVREGLLEPQR